MTKQEITREIATEVTKWMVAHRKPITSSSLLPILKRHITKEIGLEEITDYLQSKGGRRIWHATMEACLKG